MRTSSPCLSWLLALGAGIAGLVAASAATDPVYYRKQATWHDTFLKTVEALDAAGLEDGFSPFESDVRSGGQGPLPIRVPVTGARWMYLLVSGDPDKIWGVADWADARLLDAAGQAQPLTTAGREQDGRPALDWTVLKGRHEINLTLHSGLYEPLRLAGREFERGLHVQADSVVKVALEGRYRCFEAWIGVDDWARTQGHVRFRVLGERAAAVEQLWDLVERDFPQGRPRREMRWEQLDRIWSAAWQRLDLRALARRYADACGAIPPLAAPAGARAGTVVDAEGLAQVRALYLRARELRAALEAAEQFDFESVRLAVRDLWETFGSEYPQGQHYLATFASRRHVLSAARAAALRPGASLADFEQVEQHVRALEQLKRQALLANPLLEFDQLLVVKRRPSGDPRRSQWADRGLGEYVGLPRQSSWGLGTMTGVDDWENEIAAAALKQPGQPLRTLFRPGDRRLVTDVDLHWDAGRLLFSMPDARRRWQVHELQLKNGALRQLTPGDQPDVHCYDSCYLANDQVLFLSTAPLQGVPCNAGVIVGMIYKMEADGRAIRQICFEQDHDYTPSVLNDGRVLYLRWDYTDTPHVWNRLLMAMNPDGTAQMEYYGSGSYWPNATFFARAIPGHPTRIAAIVTGHHEGRVGELVILDPAQGRHETSGVVQRVPGRGRPVPPVIEDKPTEHSWPKSLHPWPLSDKYFLVACKPQPDDLWGIYLVDVFDNRVLLREEEEYALLEPIPLRPRPRPPILEDKTRPEAQDATVYLENIHQGPGLKDVPPGTVQRLRIFTYHFGFQKLAGIDHRVGTDGPWEIKRVLGTVPVEADGSALFKVPARTPISLQPLDADGQALALMRSWMTAMPGEVVSCVGCHDRLANAPPNRGTLAQRRAPSEIEPWRGPVRGFSFAREIQPVLDRYCVGCHNGQPDSRGRLPVDLRADQGHYVIYEHGDPQLRRIAGRTKAELIGRHAGVFEPSYIALRAFVRVGGLESDLHPLPPKEFAADTSELVQLLRKGHQGVRLDAEAWERLFTWIDLNAPCHGSWGETHRIPIADQPERRRLLRRLYGGPDDDPEALPTPPPTPALAPVIPSPPAAPPAEPVRVDSWPFDAAEAQRRQVAAGLPTQSVDLGRGLRMDFVRIPAGRFVLGDAAGEPDEQPPQAVEVKSAFWMGRFEVTHEQFRRFDPSFDSRFEHRTSWIFDASYLGWPLNGPRQPVVRVSWQQAMAFCRWLSDRTGLPVTLPTELQWEYACRAGTATPLAFGAVDSDFSRHANMADVNLRRLAYEGWRPRSPDLVPREDRVDDGMLVTADVGRYAPNAWGLHDMHGNAAEWTRSPYRRYGEGGGVAEVNNPASVEAMVVRGGSWRDRPQRCRSAFRLSYPAYQRVFNVGFRVVIPDR